MIHPFHSHLKPYIEGVIESRRMALGYSYKTQSYILRCFDFFCAEHYPEKTGLTKEMALHWAQRRDGEHKKSLEGRISPIRQLAKYTYFSV
ncbi:hypothetical protein [Neobacillus cucumis]|uniref:hypothetical protein n=1 Tax=Neobacillus cucumis TaxID=1740721 RepID=UPI00285311E8|nr:hypothetical protein [Neobacillus cucumis]MDR4949904.1 hypothetical protein [Neobacillus cucumis]